MNWTEQPATESQIRHLHEFGYAPDHPLNRDEAARLLHELETSMQVKTAVNRPGGAAGPPTSQQTAFDFHARVRSLSSGGEGDGVGIHHSEWAVGEAVRRRQQFWMDSCREPALMQHRSPQAVELYMKHGCLFVTPSAEQVQEILDALDASMQCWDRDYPQLFFQTLELNFPNLKTRR
jgi:hypothetical protein